MELSSYYAKVATPITRLLLIANTALVHYCWHYEVHAWL